MVLQYTINYLLAFRDKCTKAPKGLVIPDYGVPQPPPENDRLSWRKRKTHRPPRVHHVRKPPPTFSKRDLHAKVLSLLNKLGKANLDATFKHLCDLLKNETDQSVAARYLFDKICDDEPALMPLYLTLCDRLNNFKPFKEAFESLAVSPVWSEEVMEENEGGAETVTVSDRKKRGYCVLSAELIRRGALQCTMLTENDRSADIIFNGAISELELLPVYMYLCERLFKCDRFKSRFISLCQSRPWSSQVQSGASDQAEVFSAEYYREEVVRQRYKGYSMLVAALFKRGFIVGKDFLRMLEGLRDDAFTEPETLDCLCNVLSDCGVVLDRHFKAESNAFVDTLIPLTKDSRLPARLRFKVMDLIDLRNRHWVPKAARK